MFVCLVVLKWIATLFETDSNVLKLFISHSSPLFYVYFRFSFLFFSLFSFSVQVQHSILAVT